MKKRNFGLDIIRALAISLVLLDHAWYFNPNSSPLHPNLLGVTGYAGVELFFVLSGFLIGRIAFKSIGIGGIKKLPTFYLRRWFRTLPLYYILLILFIFASNFIYHTNEVHPLHFVFLQNFIPKESDFFSIAWSLAIEEWFYLLLPVFLLLASLKAKTGKGLLKAVAFTIIGVFLIRLVVVSSQPLGFNDVRKYIPLRFDSLLIGVFLSGLKMYYAKLYRTLQNIKIFLFSTVLLGGLMVYFSLLNSYGVIDKSFFYKSIGLSLVSICIAGLLPFIENSQLINKRLAAGKYLYKIITGLSIVSYSLYLVHLEINTIFIKFLSGSIPFYILFAMATVMGLLFSVMLYKFIEKPVMSLRDKITFGKQTNILTLRAKFWENLLQMRNSMHF